MCFTPEIQPCKTTIIQLKKNKDIHALRKVGIPGKRNDVARVQRQKRIRWVPMFDMYQFSSVAQSCPTLWDPMDYSMLGLPVYHQLPEFTQTHAHRVSDAIQPSHPLLTSSPPMFNLSQHQGLFQWVSSSHQVAKVLEFQLQHQSYQWVFRTYFL